MLISDLFLLPDSGVLKRIRAFANYAAQESTGTSAMLRHRGLPSSFSTSINLIARTIIAISGVVLASSSAQAQSSKKLIAFGWHTPTTAEIRANIKKYEQVPVDGVGFDTFVRDSAGKRRLLFQSVFRRVPLNWPMFREGLADLKATPFRKLTERLIRFQSMPADGVDWFDGFSTVVNNISQVGRFVKEANLAGVFFDPEPYSYGKNVWRYSDQKYAKTRSLADYRRQAFHSGRHFIDALQKAVGRPFVVYLPFTYELPPPDSDPNLKTHRYGLYGAFLDGMIRQANSSVKFVSSYAWSYGSRTQSEFDTGWRTMTYHNLKKTRVGDKYPQWVSFGFSSWIDNASNRSSIGWSPSKVNANYFTPAEFQQALTLALRKTQKYVWIYNQVPDLFTGDKMNSAYYTAMQNARRAVGMP